MSVLSFGLENFRVFKEYTEIDFRPITVLTGPNNSGKSSIMKALKLLQDSIKDDEKIPFELNFIKQSHLLGNFESARTRNSNKDYIRFSVKKRIDEWNEIIRYDFYYKYDESNKLKNGKLSKIEIFISDTLIAEFIINFTSILNICFLKDYIIKKSLTKYKNNIKSYLSSNELNKKYKPEITDILVEALFNFTIKYSYYYIDLIKKDAANFLKLHPHKTYFSFLLFSFLNEENSKIVDSTIKTDYIKQLSKILNIKEYKSIQHIVNKLSEFENKFISNKLFMLTYFSLYLDLDLLNIEYSIFYGNAIYNALILKILEFIKKTGEVIYQNYYQTDKILQTINKNFLFKYFMFYHQEDNLIIQHNEQINEHFKKYLEIIFYKMSKNEFFTYYNQIIKNGKTIIKLLKIEEDYTYLLEQKYTLKNYKKEDEIYDSFSGSKTDKKEFIYFTHQKHFNSYITKLFSNEIKKILTFIQKLNFIKTNRAYSSFFYQFNSESYFNKLLYDIESKPLENDAIEFINYWLNKFGIKEELKLEIDEFSRGVSIKFGDKNLSEFGSGIVQVLPLLLHIGYIVSKSKQKSSDEKQENTNKTLYIEEPEINLHPKWQSLMADMFWDAHKKFNINFIIETHSEYLIRKLQVLTAKGEISPHDTVIYYLYDKEENPGKLQKIEIDENGYLSAEFGPGFFDESAKLISELWNKWNLN